MRIDEEGFKLSFNPDQQTTQAFFNGIGKLNFSFVKSLNQDMMASLSIENRGDLVGPYQNVSNNLETIPGHLLVIIAKHLQQRPGGA